MTDERLHSIQYIRNNNKRFLVIALSSTETHITTGSHERGNKKNLSNVHITNVTTAVKYRALK